MTEKRACKVNNAIGFQHPSNVNWSSRRLEDALRQRSWVDWRRHLDQSVAIHQSDFLIWHLWLVVDRKSMFGYVFLEFDNTISWSTKKQTAVTILSTELSSEVCDAIGHRGLLWEMVKFVGIPTVIHEDGAAKLSLLRFVGYN